MTDIRKLCGWVRNDAGVTACLENPNNKHPVFAGSARRVMADYEKKDTLLYEPLLRVSPNYARIAQGIGDCVSFGAELAATLLVAKACLKNGRSQDFCEIATEPFYGGARVEMNGGRPGGYEDGAYGAAAAQFAREYGSISRKDHSRVTGNPEHDLRVYSKEKAKRWGNFGCGGQRDGGTLDRLAKEFPCKTTSQVHNFDEIAATIAGSKCPVTIASEYGTDMRRDKDGYCKWNDSWPHQMALIGVRFGRKPGCLCGQSWGPNVASGPHYPETMPNNIRGFTWWIPATDIDKIARTGDCHAFGDIDGWKIDPFDWSALWN